METAPRRFWPWTLLVAAALVLLVALGLVFGSSVFGSVADWAAALGTIAAFGGTVALLWRDLQERERRQAALVSCWLVEEPVAGEVVWGGGTVHVRNASDEPIYAVVVTQDPGHHSEPREWSVLGPHQEVHDLWRPDMMGALAPGVVPVVPGIIPRPRLSFFDAAGFQWERDGSGILHRGRLRRGGLTRPS